MPDDDDHDDGINNVHRHTENSILVRLMLVDPMIRNRYGHNL